jgi:hypothetical protein
MKGVLQQSWGNEKSSTEMLHLLKKSPRNKQRPTEDVAEVRRPRDSTDNKGRTKTIHSKGFLVEYINVKKEDKSAGLHI